MFNYFFNQQQKNDEIAAEKRQMDFQREHTATASAMAEDQVFLANQESKADLIKWQQDLGDELLELIHIMKGNEFIDGNWVKSNKPLCNDLFISEVIIPQCRPLMSRNLINSNFTEKTILSDLNNTSNDVADAMADGYDKYAIDFTNFDLIIRMIKNTIKAAPYRAKDGWTKKTDNELRKVIETTSQSVPLRPEKNWKGFGVF